ncbi:uncharacterized protein V1516DRAFT_668667 [Lipomyces oligophaga]|uniref:uncharacterized protein n=1 Tax=Lipomyces oligophaga TaxID=45792 RepID=UPI0034CFE7DB
MDRFVVLRRRPGGSTGSVEVTTTTSKPMEQAAENSSFSSMMQMVSSKATTSSRSMQSNIQLIEKFRTTSDSDELLPAELSDDPVSTESDTCCDDIEDNSASVQSANPNISKSGRSGLGRKPNKRKKLVNQRVTTLESIWNKTVPNASPSAIVKLKISSQLLRQFTAKLEVVDREQDMSSSPPTNESQASPPTPPTSKSSSEEECQEITKPQEKKKRKQMFICESRPSPSVPESSPLPTTIEFSQSSSLKVKQPDHHAGRKIHPFFLIDRTPATISSSKCNNEADNSPSFKSSTPLAKTDQVHAPWPTMENRHVRPYSDQPSRPRPVHVTQSRKGKGKTLTNHTTSIFSAHLPNIQHPVPIRIPNRHVLTLIEISNIARTTLTQRDHIWHPYLKYLCQILATPKSQKVLNSNDTKPWTQKYAPISAEQIALSSDGGLVIRKWVQARLSARSDRKSKTLTISTWKRSRDLARAKSINSLDDFVIDDEEENQTEDDSNEPEVDIVSETLAAEQAKVELSNSDFELSRYMSAMNPESAMEEEAAPFSFEDSINKRQLRRSERITSSLSSISEKETQINSAVPERPSINSNVLILAGPPSSMKTSATYAVAREFGYQVFEINSGQRRSGKDILKQVGEMSQSQLVHRTNFTIETQESDHRRGFVLIEDVDILFEDDKSFWPTVIKFIETSKRPVILTCTDVSLIPQDLLLANPGSLLLFTAIDNRLLASIAWTIALSEGHLLRCTDVEQLISWTDSGYGSDLRKAITNLQFWCQMAIGDDRKGLNWMIPHSRNDPDQSEKKVLSESTFVPDCLKLCTSIGPKQDQDDLIELDPLLRTDLASLEVVCNLLSATDVWQSASHTLFQVPMVCCI